MPSTSMLRPHVSPGAPMPAVFLVALVSLWPAFGQAGSGTAPAPESLSIATFERGPGRWRRRTWPAADGAPKLEALQADAAVPGHGDGRWLRLPVQFPGKSEFVVPAEESWEGWQEVALSLFLPEGLPPDTVITVFTKDRDHLWRQVRLPAPPERGRLVDIRVPIAGPEAAAAWTSHGHERPWHQTTPRFLLEYGCSIETETGSAAAFTGDLRLARVALNRPGRAQVDRPLGALEVTPRAPRLGERVEVTFTIADGFRDPFSKDSVDIRAVVTTPSGATEVVQGFYFEGFLYDPQIAEKTQTLTPYGPPAFKVRYSPRQVGHHAMAIAAVVEGREVSLPPIAFNAQPPAVGYRGVLRRDPDHPKYLMWEDGTHYWGIGLNVRSPFDERYLRVAPYSMWRDEGLPLYSRLFRRYREVGIDMVEVWMSSWWLALEWINDAPGFHGVGHYNQYRAWMLDRIVEEAEANGIQIILAIHNHGKFGALNDTEWARNPFNRVNGGFLDSCEEFFTDDRARAEFRKLADYIVARWGASPNVCMWKLFTEIDLTGTSYDFYTKPQVAEWHREMGAYIKSIDLYQHLVTTHWMLSYQRINDAIALLPELDLVTTDAYYQGGGTAQLLNLLRGGNAFAGAKGKPLLITEYGGSPHADSMGNLIKQVHLGIWTGFFHEAPAAPMFWWFALVDEKGLYHHHTALRRYTDGEDRRGMQPSHRTLPGTSIVLNELRDETRLFAWGFDADYYLSDLENTAPVPVEDLSLEIPALKGGAYALEFWDVMDGTRLSSTPLTIESGQSTVKLAVPRFQGDFALKLRPADNGD